MVALLTAAEVAALPGSIADLPRTSRCPNQIEWCDSEHRKKYGPGREMHVGAWQVVNYDPRHGGYGLTLGYVHRYQDHEGGRSVRARVLVLGGGYVWRPLPDQPDEWWAPVVKRALRWVGGAVTAR